MSNELRKKILFVGAGGELASKVLPLLSVDYDIVGIAGKRQDLKNYCIDFYSGNLLLEYEELFSAAFAHHSFDAIIWNPVQYFFSPLMQSSRESLHAEFDMAVALPVECVRMAMRAPYRPRVFIVTSSLSAFGYAKHLPSYGIVKNAQVKLTEMFTHELGDRMAFKTIAPGSVSHIQATELADVYKAAIENIEPTRTLYKISGTN